MSIELFSRKDIDQLTYKVIGAAIEVHKALGPGLLESVYHACLKEELFSKNIRFASEIIFPLKYKSCIIDTELRLDLLVDNILAIELKAIETILPVHEAQLLTYMKLLSLPKGILINFNCVNIFKEGQKTYVNNLYRQLSDHQ